MATKISVKATNHKCLCVECCKPIVKGEVRIQLLIRYYHAQCFVDIVESIPDIETLWKNSATKNVLARLKGEDEST
jgi:hypothetical protein